MAHSKFLSICYFLRFIYTYVIFGILAFIIAPISCIILAVVTLRGRDIRNNALAMGFGKFMRKAIGFNLEIRNKHQVPEDNAIYILNHQSMLDIVILAHLIPARCILITKRSIMYTVPLFALAIYLCGHQMINRSNREQSISSLKEAVEDMKKKKTSTFAFPEGTRTVDSKLQPFKKGAFHMAVQAQFPLVPMVISTFEHVINFKSWKVIGSKFIVEVLPVIPTEGRTASDVEELLDQSYHTMNETFLKINKEVIEEKKLNDP